MSLVRWVTHSLIVNQRFKISRSEAGQVNHMLGARIRQDLKQGTLAMDQTVAAGIEEPVTLIPARQLDTEGSCPFTNSNRVFPGGSGILSCVFRVSCPHQRLRAW